MSISSVIFKFHSVPLLSNSHHCCRRRGCRAQAHPQRSWFGKNPWKISENSEKIKGNLGKICKNLCKSLKIFANSPNIQAKMVPKVLWFEKKMAPKITLRHFSLKVIQNSVFMQCTKDSPNYFRASFGKFGQKSFAPPKMCVLLHLCVHTSLLFDANCFPESWLIFSETNGSFCFLNLFVIAFLVNFDAFCQTTVKLISDWILLFCLFCFLLWKVIYVIFLFQKNFFCSHPTKKSFWKSLASFNFCIHCTVCKLIPFATLMSKIFKLWHFINYNSPFVAVTDQLELSMCLSWALSLY